MSKMVDFARAQVGKPYKHGRSGPDEYDCSGLTKRAAAQIGLALYHGATMQWNRGRGIEDPQARGHPAWIGYFNEYGPISTLPEGKIAFLFNQDMDDYNKVTMAHVGIYDGRGRVIQAGGQYKGVSDKPINRSRWSHWATFQEEWTERDGPMSEIFLTIGSVGPQVKEVQEALLALKYDLGPWGADGKFGKATAAAVKEYQIDKGLLITGTWGKPEQDALQAPPPDPGPDPWAEVEQIADRLKALAAKNRRQA